MNIWVLSDGKPGHTSQTMGLAHGLGKITTSSMTTIDLSGMALPRKLSTLRRCLKQYGKPDLCITAGHSTHIPLLYVKWLNRRTLTVLCMKPSLPTSLFDVCIMPRHDLTADTPASARLIPTVGALNGISPDPNAEKTHTLVLIGGPSKEFGMEPATLAASLAQDVVPFTTNQLLLTTSRRTPQEFIPALKATQSPITIIPVEETPRGWVAEQLAHATAAWVTQDSVSMIYEALSAGVPVGILPMPHHPGKKPSRVSRGLDMLIAENRVTSWPQWLNTHSLTSSLPPLQEADRVARELLNFYPHLLS